MSELTRREFFILAGAALVVAVVAPAARARPWVRYRLERHGTPYYSQGTMPFRRFMSAVLPYHRDYALVRFELIEPPETA